MSGKYTVVDYESRLPPTRIKSKDLKMAKRIVRADDETYDSLSHYIRCAIIKQNREEKKRLRL